MGCDFRGRWLWVLGPVLLGPVPVLLVFWLCLVFLFWLAFFPFFFPLWLFAFWTGSEPTGFLPVDLGPLFSFGTGSKPTGFLPVNLDPVFLSGLDPSQRVFFPLTWILFLFPGVFVGLSGPDQRQRKNLHNADCWMLIGPNQPMRTKWHFSPSAWIRSRDIKKDIAPNCVISVQRSSAIFASAVLHPRDMVRKNSANVFPS